MGSVCLIFPLSRSLEHAVESSPSRRSKGLKTGGVNLLLSINWFPGVFKVVPVLSSQQVSPHVQGTHKAAILNRNSCFGQIYFKADIYLHIYIFFCSFELALAWLYGKVNKISR